MLSLSFNRISDIKALSSLANLRNLSLARNQLTDISDLASLLNLTKLNISGNQILDVSALQDLQNLQEFDLTYNLLSALPEWIVDVNEMQINWDESFKTGIDLYGNPLPEELISIIKQGNDALRNYFIELRKGEDYIFEAKLAMLGEGFVGKTSLTKRLTDDDYMLETDIESTPNIEVLNKWELDIEYPKKTKFVFSIWDFGGQTKYDIAHTYFITPRSIYLLVTDKRKDENFADFERWLYAVQSYSNNSQVIIVQNKIDKFPERFSLEPYKKHFDNIYDGLIRISCNDNEKETIKELERALKEVIPNLPQCKTPLPKTWKEIKDILQGKSKDRYYLTLKEYLDICYSKGISEEKSLQISNFLNDLGIIIHHYKDPVLKNLVIIKSDWCIDAAYSVINNASIIENKGKFTFDDLVAIWKEDKYQSKINELIGLMKYYRLCFELHNSEGFLAPSMLPEDRPESYQEPKHYPIKVEYEYKLLPPGLIANIIVECHSWVINDMYWKFGVVIESNNTRAHIIEDPLYKKLMIGVEGKEPKYMMYMARYFVECVHYLFKKRSKYFNFIEYFHCPCEICRESDNPHRFESERIYERQERGITTAECDISFEPVPINDILEGIQSIRETDLIYDYLINTSVNLQGSLHTLDMGQREDNLNAYYKERTIESKGIKLEITPPYGLSAARKSVGYPDMVVFNKQTPISFIESFKLDKWDSKVASLHWDKIFGYDVHGINNFHLVFTFSETFSELWDKYCDELQKHKFEYERIRWVDVSDNSKYAEIKIGNAYHIREEKTVQVTHIFIHLLQKTKNK